MSSVNLLPQPTTGQSELQLQSDCFQWAWNTYPETRRCLWHVTNEMKPHPNESKKNFQRRISQAKAAGLVPGVSDLHFLWNGKLYVFELKVKRNGLTEDQKVFRDVVLMNGGAFFEIRDLETFKTSFHHILNSKSC